MSEEITLAAADLATVEALRVRILEWEDCYDRLAGAFELHMAIGECHAALSDYAGSYYDVVLGAQWSELQAARAALHPFATWARLALDQAVARDAVLRDDDIVFKLDDVAITVGDLRRAVAARE